jgi:hypothetical protein
MRSSGSSSPFSPTILNVDAMLSDLITDTAANTLTGTLATAVVLP